MKNNLLNYSLTAVVLFVAAAICPAQRPPMVGGYKETSKTDKTIIAAANFAVETRIQQDASLKLVGVKRAARQIVAGSNYEMCLAVTIENKAQEATAVVYHDLQNNFSLTSWTSGKCSAGAQDESSAAVKTTAVSKRVALSKTTPCVVLSGAVQPKNFDTYIFSAKKGQTIVASPYYFGDETDRPEDDVQGLSGYVIVLPNGEQFEDPQDDQLRAEQTGNYKILVRPAYTRTTGKYALKISVTDKVPELSDPNEPPTCGQTPTKRSANEER